MACPNSEKCPLFPMFSLEATLKTWKLRYCDSDYSRCVRYQRASAGNRPPDNMLPNGELLRVRRPTTGSKS